MEERKLVSLAKNGNKPAQEKLLIHLVGFLIFRIETALSRTAIINFGEDILQECILFVVAKIQRYKVRFKNKDGIYKTYCFSTYLWKGITGVIYTYVKNNSRPVFVFTEPDSLIENRLKNNGI
jgi:hypothetical protein